MSRVLSVTALVCALCLLPACLVVAPASAAGLSAPVADCDAHGKLTHHYTVSQLRGALAGMPADIREYSDCYDVIEQQLLAQIGGQGLSGGSGDGGGSFLPTWLIVVLALLVLGAGGFAAFAWRRREEA